ncbi:WxL domain-containing protein (plasmid) [Bacillus thuringiensis]|uniref:WxL domain-containing protein n=1 Tax=Bacillus thuringiensis TaxID=1428 RepID=UPI0022250449|nr:WxL domain-containing protein [Bacillus thuringiensis]UYX55668.1 WxL domain-containing protein [Bacillus thuringiensis]UYX55788.1 WxL domain-containing protein [Bacillus thuringiensis]
MKLIKVIKPSLAAMALAVVTMGTPASAATTVETKLNQGIIGGEHNLEVTPVSNFNAVTLNGETQVTHADPGTLVVTDARGTGEGYRVNVRANQFKVSADTKSDKTLPKGSLVLSSGGADVTKVGGTQSQNPEFKAENFVIDTDNQSTILSAKKDQGMGKYNIKFKNDALSLTLNPHSTYVVNKSGTTTYESVLTYSVVTGP